MNYTISIEKLMFWREGKWAKSDNYSTNATLKIHYDQLLIFNGNKLLESLNMNTKMKGFFKGDVLILITSTGTQLRKIKFRIKSNLIECLQTLEKYFPIVNHDADEKGKVFTCKYRDIEAVLNEAILAIDNTDNNLIQMPSNFSAFVKMCVLDPTFPEVVRETQNILQKF